MPAYNPSPEQESIYNLLPAYQAPTPKQALYRSKVCPECWSSVLHSHFTPELMTAAQGES